MPDEHGENAAPEASKPRRSCGRARLEDTFGKPPPSPVRLHPHLAEAYRRPVADLAKHLESEDGWTEALEIVRSLIERVAVKPAEGGGIEIVGELASMVEVALVSDEAGAKTETTLRDAERRSVKVVAGARYQRCLPDLKCGLRVAKLSLAGDAQHGV